MTRRIIFVGHANDECDDRASAWAAERGFGVDWRFPYDGDELPAIDENVAGVVVYGGRFDVDPKEAHPFLRSEARLIEAALKQDLPLLGFCLGGQLMADVLGAPVGPHPEGNAEYGYYPLIMSDAGRAVFGDDLIVLQSHWHGWFDLPAGAVHLASTAHFPEQAFRYGNNAYAMQFHPEASYAMMSRWAARRPAHRHAMPGAFPPERQLADHAIHDAPLGAWFNGFLDDWMAGSAGAQQAAE
ncbi:MAG: glutamine amidotransferase [Rhizobiales bacterium]|nr:glutamine amidotransferase [Hyphomicrobiales bacterium]